MLKGMVQAGYWQSECGLWPQKIFDINKFCKRQSLLKVDIAMDSCKLTDSQQQSVWWYFGGGSRLYSTPGKLIFYAPVALVFLYVLWLESSTEIDHGTTIRHIGGFGTLMLLWVAMFWLGLIFKSRLMLISRALPDRQSAHPTWFVAINPNGISYGLEGAFEVKHDLNAVVRVVYRKNRVVVHCTASSIVVKKIKTQEAEYDNFVRQLKTITSI